MSNIVHLPYQFFPRDYQLETMKAFFVDGIKNFVDIEHRRAGKDKKWLNIMVAASQMRVGLYLHSFPNLTQAKKVIWNGIDKDGRRFLDHIPRSLIAKVNNSEMAITFKNGSIYRLAGADYYDSWMGTNPVFVAYSEYAIGDPMAAQHFAPILAENGGWQAYFYTPRGRNHGQELWENNKDNPKWFSQHLTVDQTRQYNGEPVISKQAINDLRDSGMSEELIQQEFYCSFEAAIEGAYFAEQIREARNTARILDFLIDSRLAVSTYWDLGTRDKTAIWFIQKEPHSDDFNVIGYYENFNKDAQHYVNYVRDFGTKYNLTFERHYAPHDGAKREFTTNTTIIDAFKKLGLHMKVVPRITRKEDGIEAVRGVLSKCRFHETNCKHGLSCLTSYHGKKDDKNGIYGNPVHDWASHGADAFMQFAQSYRKMHTINGQILANRIRMR